jgi:hypothetical protein
MIPIDRTEIEAWGRRHEAKGEFPFLIAKLIFETTPRSTFFEIPSGSAVFLEGWDGIVHCKEETTFVPIEISLWEFKTNCGKSQADSDYNKRKKDSLGYDKSKSTFIFVTTNNWTDKEEWVKEKKEENIWADVRVYDSTNLQNWLCITDIASKWFIGTILGRSYENCLTIEDFWENWSIGPKLNGKHVILNPRIVTVGREIESQRLIDFLNGAPDLFAIRGTTKDEAIAFIIATAMLTSEQFYFKFHSKGIVIEYLQDFRLMKKSNFNLNLIVKFDDRNELFSAVSRQHHVLLPLGPDDPFTSQNIITLPLLDRDGQVKALIHSGLSEEEASRYSKESARDITILKRLIGFQLNKAKWEITEEVHELVPALLIGRWDENKEGDRKVLEKLSGDTYDIYSEKLNKWLVVESPPLIRIGCTWRLTSPLEAWTNLSNCILVRDFENLRESFLQVMAEINPVFELEPGERQMASFRGKESLYSAWCREGLTQSMVLIGLYGDKLKFQHRFSPQVWVDGIIKEFLYEAPGDLWASRNSEMPLIAEASPKSFFESAYHSLSLDDKPIMNMFIEEDGFISPTSHHTGLLWSLEGLAWTEEYFFNSSMLLAHLASLDPGGKLANRPMNSLREIFKPWHYQTLASFDDRLKILEQIIKNEYKIGWDLLRGMIPKSPDTAFPTHKLRWRLFERSFESKSTWPEVFETHSKVIDLLIKYFDFSERRLIDLLETSESKQIQPPDREKILSFIELNLDKINVTGNSAWNELRSILSNHRSYSNETWSLPETVLKRYESIYTKLEPSDPVERVIWMFNDQWPNFPEGIERKALLIREQEEIVLSRRIEGLKGIYQKFGFECVKDLAKIVKETLIYGDILARIIEKEDEVLLLCDDLKEDEGPILHFIQQFIFRKSLINGVDWVFELYGNLKTIEYTDTQLARLFHKVEQTKTVWEFIDKTSTETQNAYWEGIYPHFWGLQEIDLIYGIDRLFGVNRFISALEIAYYEPQKLPTKKLVEILEKAGTQKSKENRQFDSFHVTRIIEVLETREDIEKPILFRLEWLYLPFLVSYGSMHKPSVLHEELANNPEFFLEVLKLVYKSDKEEEKEDISDEVKNNKGKNAYELLSSWKQIPGVDEVGNIDEDFLWNWINKVRELAEKSGRLKVADIQIGQVLAEYPEEKEPWPPQKICRVIELINTQSLKSGFSSATFNKRGFSTRGPFDGGNIERGHAKYFRLQADLIKYDFPKTAEILIHLVDGYEADAKRMDEMADRDKLEI